MSDFASNAPILGVVLAGGRSKRMGRDKASLWWEGQPLWRRQAELLRACGLDTALSIRSGQTLPGMVEDEFEWIPDSFLDAGPLAGFLSAWEKHPLCALLVVACDLPLLDRGTIEHLLAGRDCAGFATAYLSAHDGLPEPLCAIYEPSARAIMQEAIAAGRRCPRKLLIQGGVRVRLLELKNPTALENANTPEDLTRLGRSQQETTA